MWLAVPYFQKLLILYINTVYAWRIGGSVTDLFFESLALQRIDLVARLVTESQCKEGDRDLALVWIAELTTALTIELDKYEQKSLRVGGFQSGGSNRAL